MAGTNDFQQFANGAGANVISQSAYLTALAAALANGFVAGTALSDQVNKVLRQSATMAAVMGQIVADVTGANATDDGVLATILGNFYAAMAVGAHGADSGAVNAYVVTLSPAIPALYDGMEVNFYTANQNTGASTLNVNGTGAIALVNADGSPVGAGRVRASRKNKAVYNAAAVQWELHSGDNVPPGIILPFGGSVIPGGWLAVPTAVTNVSRTTYAALFAAIGTAWGSGDGSTTFGLPFMASGYVPIVGSLGVLSHGALLMHTHPSAAAVSGNQILQVGGTAAAAWGSATGSTGGPDNLAAGMGVQYIVKY